MKDKPLSEGEVKARLAQAEAQFSHYRWDDAIAIFEAILAAQPDHPLATQGWARAVEQKSLDEELKETLAKARASLSAQRFDEALGLLNHAQTRGALMRILKYHSEIDGLRSEAQEGLEWQRRVEATVREAEMLAGRRRFDQALETLDETLRGLRARGWERLGERPAALREKLWAERDVSDRVQFAQAAYEREDFALAAELADALFEELPGREDVRRLRERSRAAWGRLAERLAAVNAALAEARTEDALALLANLRADYPHNPDWQAVALRVYMEDGRSEFAKGRALLAQEVSEDAAEAFDAAQGAFAAVAEIFPEHPTARHEQTEATALRQVALAAGQAARDRAARRWEASRQEWQAARERLDAAMAARGREFSEVAAVVDAALAETGAALADVERARLMLTEGRQALDARDAGAAREAFRAGLSRVEGGRLGDAAHLNELRDGLVAGLREAERIQRDVKKLLSQAEAAEDAGQRLAVLRRAYERWETAPGLATRLAEELLAAAENAARSGQDDAALDYCEQVAGVTGAPAGALSDAARLAARITTRRAEQAAQAEAAELAAQAEAVERALGPVENALRSVDEICAPAADGELAAVDWDAAEAGVKAARKALRAARAALQPLPPRWEELKTRVDALEQRNQLLRDLAGRMASGRGIDAMPALQAYATDHADPLVLAVLERVLREGSDDALTAARMWLTQATSALERGELVTAGSYVAVAQNYVVAAPHVAPELRRVERQIALLTEARDRTRVARALAGSGDVAAAAAEFRAALEVMTDGESGLPAHIRGDILRILDAAEPPALLDNADHPLAQEYLAPSYGGWRRLTQQTQATMRAQAQAGAWGRRLKRSQRLAGQGAYADALKEIGAEQFAGVDGESEEAEALADEADELRRTLGKLLELSEHIAPLVGQMREAALAGQYDEALAARERAEWFDPGRRAGALWAEMDELAALIDKRRRPPAPAPRAMPPAPVLSPPPPVVATPAPPEDVAPVVQPPGNGKPQRRPEKAANQDGEIASPIPVVETENFARNADAPEPAPAPVAALPEPVEPPAPFDLDDWLSNVTELGPDGGPGNEP